LHIAAEAQKFGGIVAFIDAEHDLDTAYAKNLGVQVEDLLLSQPDEENKPWKYAKLWFVALP
jgi:recombination protein RecA